MPKIAVLQMTSGIDPWVNFETIRDAAFSAQEGGAEILFTPEMSLLLDRNRKRAAEHVMSETESRYVKMLSNLAEETELYIALGSMPVATDRKLWANRSMLFWPSGEAPQTYDKIHMFDVDLVTGESWRESNAYLAGNRVFSEDITVTRMTKDGDEDEIFRLGLTVCYDVRFPALFEELGRRKCDVIAIPAAFTVPTGRDHWHVMMRARAIESSAFVVAAAQVGEHEDGRKTYGHSLVIDPWGEVLLDMGGEEAGLAFVDIDLGRIAEVRAQLPSLANKREIPK
ncbi:carbon-nitrogen hydrolase family protein [Altererythrobacter sp. MF3-039]|uniref:carbon-nitrogen hydrolase family protein n=1 Tax=Altererythrobacter sp. MF3-039 TaxID=3252901 RepID=UPI00390CCA16